MTSNSELITWAVPGVTWTLALIAYVVLQAVEKRLKLKRSRASSRRLAGGLAQARHPGLVGTEYQRAQHNGPHAAPQS